MKQQFSGVLSGLFLVVFGAAFAVAGWIGIELVQPYDDGVTTTATVVDNIEGSVLIDGIAHPDYSPVYVFETEDGESYRIADYTTGDSHPLPIGSTVEISYRPDDPGSPRRIDVDRDWLKWFIFGGLPVAAFGVLRTTGSLVGLVRGAATR